MLTKSKFKSEKRNVLNLRELYISWKFENTYNCFYSKTAPGSVNQKSSSVLMSPDCKAEKIRLVQILFDSCGSLTAVELTS